MSNTNDGPLLGNLKSQMSRGALDRREFVRLAALIGVSAGAAYAMAGLPTSARAEDATAGAKRGGKLRIGQRVAKMDDPAIYSWNEMTNQSLPIIEHMTMIGPDNVVHPMLIERWEPSDDLKTWTFHVRKGVMWHNGEELTAEHIAFNIRRWTDSSLGSSNIALATFGALTEETGAVDAKGKKVRIPAKNGIEIIDTHTLKLNLSRAVLSVPQDCAEFTTLIVHPSFKAPFSDSPIGTGAYSLSELKAGERCILKRLTKTTDGKDFKYWDGDAYLDEIHYYHFDPDNAPLALASGSIDALYSLTVEQIPLAQTIANAQVKFVETASTLCCRMQVDVAPFSDKRVRQAIVMASDNTAIQQLVFPNGGVPGENHHVAKIHPEYVALPPLKRDVEGAKRLLKEAGFEKGLHITIDIGNTDGTWQQSACEALRDQLKDAGINLAVNVLPASKFWEVWDKTPFGATSWAHRSLGTMVLGQAYRSGVPWNETHFSDPEFDKILSEAEGTLDVEKRKTKMAILEKILQDACIMVQPTWWPIFTLCAGNVHGYEAHPSRKYLLNKVWIG